MFSVSLCVIRDSQCAEIITELIPERAGPAIFKSFLLELIPFRLIPVICPAREAKPEKLLETRINSDFGREFPSRNLRAEVDPETVPFQAL